MKKVKYLLLIFLLVLNTGTVFSQAKQAKIIKPYQATLKSLKITGYINVIDKRSQDYMFMALKITRGDKPVKGLKVTLNGTAGREVNSSYNYQGSKHGVTIKVGTSVKVKIYSRTPLSLSPKLLAAFNGQVTGVIRYIKPLLKVNAYKLRTPFNKLGKLVKIKWRFVGKIASPVQYLRLKEYPGNILLVEKYNHHGTEASFKTSLFKPGKTYKISLLKPQHPLLKPRGSNLDPSCEMGIRYIAEYEDAKALLTR